MKTDSTPDEDPYQWFKRDTPVFLSATQGIRSMLPREASKGIEIACGPGHFSETLKIPSWPNPSQHNRTGNAAGSPLKLPFRDFDMDYVFVSFCDGMPDNIPSVFAEAHRCLKIKGYLVVAFVDVASPHGRKYASHGGAGVDTESMMFELSHAGFHHFDICQTLFSPPETMKRPDPVSKGYGEGAFIVIQAKKML